MTTPFGSKSRASRMTLVCRPTPFVRFNHTSVTLLKATLVSVGTTCELNSIFTPDPTPGNPPKCYSVENVKENTLSFFCRTKNGNGSACGSAVFITAHPRGDLSPLFGNSLKNRTSYLLTLCPEAVLSPSQGLQKSRERRYSRFLS